MHCTYHGHTATKADYQRDFRPSYPSSLGRAIVFTLTPTFIRPEPPSPPHTRSHSEEILDNIPGDKNDRRTALVELHWLLTAITDTIAWGVLSVAEFQRIFRHDLLLAALFRNFMLAKRVMQTLDCNPVTYPPLPPSITTHTLWQSWDLAVEQVMTCQ